MLQLQVILVMSGHFKATQPVNHNVVLNLTW